MVSNQSSKKISDLLIINHENDLQHSLFSRVSSLGHWHPNFFFVFFCVFCVHSSEKTISSITTQQFNITTPVVQWPHKQFNDHYNYMLKVVQKFSGHWHSHSTLRTLRNLIISVIKLIINNYSLKSRWIGAKRLPSRESGEVNIPKATIQLSSVISVKVMFVLMFWILYWH